MLHVLRHPHIAHTQEVPQNAAGPQVGDECHPHEPEACLHHAAQWSWVAAKWVDPLVGLQLPSVGFALPLGVGALHGEGGVLEQAKGNMQMQFVTKMML